MRFRTRDIFIAGKIPAELDYAEKPPKPYTKQELKAMLAVTDEEEEKLLNGLFLNSGVRDAEMQNTEYADFFMQSVGVGLATAVKLGFVPANEHN